MEQHEVDLLIIGAGPAGATIAGEAARVGARVLAAEKRTGDSPSRAGVIQPRVLEQLDNRDLMGRFRDAAADWRPDFEIPLYMYAGLGPLRYDLLDSDYPYALVMPQTTTEHLLRAWAAEQGADIRRGLKYVSHVDEGDRVVAKLVDLEGGEHTVTAKYMVGADGAHSNVRTNAGIPFEGRENTLTAISVDADLSFPWPLGMQMNRNQHGWVLSYPFGTNTTRFIIVSEASRNIPTSVEPTLEEVKTELRKILEEEMTFTTVQRMSRYGNAHKMTPTMQKGRVFLCGESTRVHYPASGIGMNYCIQDGFNLGWKLGAVINGSADESLLDTYDSERHPVLQAMMDDVETQTTLHFDFSEGGLKLKDFVEQNLVPIPEVNNILRRRLTGFGTSYEHEGATHPANGRRVPKLPLDDGRRYGQIATTADFVLIDSAGGSRAIDTIAHGISSALPGTDGLEGAVTILVRPDGYVARAWAARPSDEDVLEARRAALQLA